MAWLNKSVFDNAVTKDYLINFSWYRYHPNVRHPLLSDSNCHLAEPFAGGKFSLDLVAKWVEPIFSS